MIPRFPIAILLTLACAARAPAPAPAEGPPSEAADSTRFALTIYRSPCPGGCLVYSVSVTPEGRITYTGTAEVRRLGTVVSRIPRPRLDAFLRQLEASEYFELASQYRPGEPGCSRYVPSYQTVITSVRAAGRFKRIEHDHGCGNVPPALTALERRVDEVLNTERWTGRQP